MAIPWTEESVFDAYNIFEETFKAVSSHDIKVAVLVPKNLKPGPHPIIYNLHGGFLVTAHGLFAAFYPKWVHKLALEDSAIVISPDYRLLPSANGVEDILEDLEDCWQWTKSTLPIIVESKAPGHSLNFSQTLLAGSSAGGYCTAQIALSHPDDFQAIAMVYPFLDPKDKVMMEGPGPEDPTVLRYDLKDIPSKEDTLAWIEEKRQVPHSKDDFSRTPFAVAACHHGLFNSHIFDSKRLNQRAFYPLERLEDGGQLPSTLWVMHGDEDSTVHIRSSNDFADILRRKLPHISLRYDVVSGGDHGFEFDETTWKSFAHEALGFVRKGWLSS